MKGLTVQYLLQRYLDGFLSRHTLPLYRYKALRQLLVCRTAVLGGHAQYCENGHLNGVWYNSCKHRACPQCRGMATEDWLQNTRAVLLDCPHHHMVFTLPSELNTLWRFNRSIMADILFKAAHETLHRFARDPRYLNATPGLMCTLHTWGRNLSLHPHIHALISHGGLSDQGQWVEPKKDVLFPQKPLMMVFRGVMLSKLKRAVKQPDWVIPPDRRVHQIVSLLNKLGRQDWVVHCCNRYDHAHGVAKYLSRYVKSGPLKNRQLKAVDDHRVTFQYRSHQTQQIETLTLSPKAFIQRWLQHVPLPGKPAVRYSGLYNSAARKRLNLARIRLGQSAVSARQQLRWQAYLAGLGWLPTCRECGLSLTRIREVAPVRRAA